MEKMIFIMGVIVSVGFLAVDIISVVQGNSFAMIMNSFITYLLIKLCIILHNEYKEGLEKKNK